MGEAFIIRRGVGGVPYAIISVKYPAGSVCTCTNGTQTLTAKDTSGKAMFVIPSAGTWTVKAVSGSSSASSTVEITAEGQVETVTLVYDLILFDGTTGEIASGYSLVGVAVQGDSTSGYYIQFAEGTSYISPVIDVSRYNTLKLKAGLKGSAYSGYSYGTIGLYKDVPSHSNKDPVAGIKMNTISYWTPQEFTVDISALKGEYYFSGFSNGWGAAVYDAMFV